MFVKNISSSPSTGWHMTISPRDLHKNFIALHLIPHHGEIQQSRAFSHQSFKLWFPFSSVVDKVKVLKKVKVVVVAVVSPWITFTTTKPRQTLGSSAHVLNEIDSPVLLSPSFSPVLDPRLRKSERNQDGNLAHASTLVWLWISVPWGNAFEGKMFISQSAFQLFLFSAGRHLRNFISQIFAFYMLIECITRIFHFTKSRKLSILIYTKKNCRILCDFIAYVSWYVRVFSPALLHVPIPYCSHVPSANLHTFFDILNLCRTYCMQWNVTLKLLFITVRRGRNSIF